MQDIEAPDAGHDARQQRLPEFSGQCRLVADILRNRKHHPPHAGNAQQKLPALRIGNVIDRNQIGNNRIEIERRVQHQKAFRPGEAFEFDAERTANFTPGAVGADQPAAGPDLLPVIDPYRHLYAIVILPNVLEPGAELDPEIAVVAQTGQQYPRQFELLALHPVWMSGSVRDLGEIELRNHPIPFRPILQLRGLQAFIDELTRNAEIVEHIKRRRMECRCPRFCAEIVAGLEPATMRERTSFLIRSDTARSSHARDGTAISAINRAGAPNTRIRLARKIASSMLWVTIRNVVRCDCASILKSCRSREQPVAKTFQIPLAIKPDRRNGSPSAYNRFPT